MAGLGGQPDGKTCSLTLNEAPVQAGKAGTEHKNGKKEAEIRPCTKTPADSCHVSRLRGLRIFDIALKTCFRHVPGVITYVFTIKL